MPLYQYEAVDRSGQKVVGTMQVTDEVTLSRRLSARGYAVTAVRSRDASAVPEAPRDAGTAVDAQSLAILYSQLAATLRAGIAPYQSLVQLAASTHHRSLSETLSHMAAAVEGGGTLSGAMERFPATFASGAVGLVRAAELGGFLDRAFALLARQGEQDHALQRAIRPWAWYLFAVFVVALFLAIPVGAFMRPAIAGGLQAGLRAYAHEALTRSLPATLAVTLLILAARTAARSPSMRSSWDAFLLRLPLIGRLARLRAGETVAETLATLYHGGVAPRAAWGAASDAVANAALASRVRAALPLVERGAPYSQAMRQSGLFREIEIQMVQTGETTGDVEEMLAKVANYYQMEIQSALDQIPILGRTLLFVIAGVITAVAVYAGYRGYVEGLIHGVDDYFSSP